VRAIANRYGLRPIWATEIGWVSRPDARHPPGSSDEQTQANLLVRATLLLWQAGVERIFWYTLKDDPEGDTYGMFALGSGRSDFSQPKPTYWAFQTLSRQLSGTHFLSTSDLFERTTVVDFEAFGVWLRGDQPYGRFSSTNLLQQAGAQAAQLTYQFPTRNNDYVVFRRAPAIPIPGNPYAIGAWVYGDSSGHTLKIWLRDAEDEILQYALGSVGPAQWRFMQAQLGKSVPTWDRITSGGNGKLDTPVRIEALVLDDAPNSSISSGTIYIDTITAMSGPEGYNLRLQRADAFVDVLWAPQPILVSIASNAASVLVSERNGQQRTIKANNGRVVVQIGPAPIYLQQPR
jgi:polysaccharide biosynthesis protein PslG